MELTETVENYILSWGEMGSRWGVNRTVAQIHALLYLSPQPLCADEIAETLSIARSNVSTSLRELKNYGLIKTTHVLGDRRDHFEAHQDIWEMFRVIVEERKKREVDPMLRILEQCAAGAENDPDTPPETKARIENMRTFLEEMNSWYSKVIALERSTLQRLIKLGDKVARFIK